MCSEETANGGHIAADAAQCCLHLQTHAAISEESVSDETDDNVPEEGRIPAKDLTLKTIS
jgi:hypothetical protein